MAQRINTPTNPAYNFPVNLSGESYHFRICWNERTEGWCLDVRTSDNIEIESGIRLTEDQPLIVYGSWELEGNLYVSATAIGTEEGLSQKITRDNFGGVNNFQLFYVANTEAKDFFANL